jgi:hypothetical protein
MAMTGGLPANFDPEDHVGSDLDADVFPEGVTALTPYLVTKRTEGADFPITCWHCYTDGTHWWCVEVDCPWGPKVVTR